ncbi:unnamed protein product, partial [Phaeothamnion confervicola]
QPLGLVLEEDGDRNVIVAEVRSGSNAAKSGKVKPGDKIAFVSATFGDEVWSARGVGLSRVQSAVKVRQGDYVTLVLESGKETAAKAKNASAVMAAKKQAEEDAAVKKARLLEELEADSQKRKKGFFGLF